LFFRSLRSRLTLWYVLILAVILATSGFSWYLYFSKKLLGHVDERLCLVAEDLASFHLVFHNELSSVDSCQALEDFVRRRNWGEYVQILDEQGRLICCSKNLQEFHLPLNEGILQQVTQGNPHFETIRPLRPHPIRILTSPFVEQGRVTKVLQVGVSLACMEQTLEELRLILLTFSPLAFLALSFGEWFLAGRVLSPVVRITRAVQKINAENLYRRLPVEKNRDEIDQLAETFNSMLARLEDSFRKIKQFSADVSHELRTPLTILKGETEVALRWAKEPPEYCKVLESNMEEIDRMGQIIDDLLTLAKSEAGQMPLEIKEFSLSALLRELYLQGKTLGESKHIGVFFKLVVAEEIRIMGDETRLRQAFLNLISNGIKYTPAMGYLEISLDVEQDNAVVTITDTGIGIPKEHLPHIFDRFYRIDEARNREEGGTGLGLSIVKWIVEAHEGRITVTSMVDEGSTISVYLPMKGPKQRQTNSVI
jgi:heavy metal sensor kinase